MQKASSSQRYAYLAALTQEIEKKLQRALNSPSQRLDMLQELFADIALGIDERAREQVLAISVQRPGFLIGHEGTDIIVDKDGGVGFSDQGIQNCLCFYDVLADHYGREPGNGKRILDLIVKLWSQSFASHIFALLFHKWLFEAPPENSESQLRFASALVQGATKYLFVDVALVPSRLDKIPLQARRDLFLLLSRFIFFYNLVDRFESFLKHFPEFPNTFLVGGPADIFVIELTDQLQKLKVEPVLLHYLSNIRTLQGLELRMTTSTRLKACLYSFTSPGGPMYPTRAVRHAAWDALDFLFPVGRYPRHVISLFFRLLYPWYWPSSCWNFIVSCVQAIVYSVLRLIFSSWDKMRRPKDL
ncbi:hypothetical protein Taro_007110 [Colocasia esculenta]|uniref:Uncharacterized protein n=1 Tax=Colocasia esculenta TaxID=4460 RepID=A0A843TU89_COLES|nr:hypothetical protein [Colocasia esculenta]